MPPTQQEGAPPSTAVSNDVFRAHNLAMLLRCLSRAQAISDIMESIVPVVRNALQADGVTLVLRDGQLCHYAEEDAIAPLWKGQRFPIESCISGWCMMKRRHAAIQDIRQDPRIPQDAYKPTFVRSLAMVPVRQDDPIAALGAYWRDVRRIENAELQFLQMTANAAAPVLLNVKRSKEREQIATARNELVHRIQNVLTVVEVLARQTLKYSDSASGFGTAFIGRLRALAYSQNLLSDADKRGADLRGMIKDQVLLGASEDRIMSSGPDVFLPADVAFDLGLVLHELGTNARKYGALVTDSGKIFIEWRPLSGDGQAMLELVWTERGGPPVEPPTRNGFGSTLLQSALRKCGGRIEIGYEPAGVVCRMVLPVADPSA